MKDADTLRYITAFKVRATRSASLSDSPSYMGSAIRRGKMLLTTGQSP